MRIRVSRVSFRLWRRVHTQSAEQALTRAFAFAPGSYLLLAQMTFEHVFGYKPGDMCAHAHPRPAHTARPHCQPPCQPNAPTCGGGFCHNPIGRAGMFQDCITTLTRCHVYARRYACVADIGWITGHSYIVYGPLRRVSKQKN